MPQSRLALGRSRSDPPGRCRLALHGHLPGVPGLTVGSTPVCDLRATPGDLPIAVLGEVARRVRVPAEDEPAVCADVIALGQGQLGSHRSAPRARPARREPPVRDDHPAAMPCGLVLHLPAELPERRVRDVPGQPPVPRHPGCVQVLDHDRPELRRQAGRQLVQAVPALVGDAALRLAERGGRPTPPVRRPAPGTPVRPLPARYRAGQAPQLPQRAGQVPGVGDLLAGRQHGQRLDAEVDADDGVRKARRGTADLGLDSEGDKPAPPARTGPTRTAPARSRPPPNRRACARPRGA
jgi:hypothetical protein